MTLQKFEHESYITKMIGCGVLQTAIYNKKDETNDATLVNHSERMSYALERFSHACAHELKEPLRSAASFVHLLLHKNEKQFDEESLGHLYQIRQNIDRMDMLIRDIAYYLSIVEQTSHAKVTIDTNEIFYSIKEKFKKRLAENGAHQFTIGTLPIVSGVRMHIYRLFLNLINNAFKFCYHKPMHINVFAIEQEKFWEFHVCDNGIGIKNEYHESIFHMFSRLHHKNSYEGSGIGLAICKEIVQKHHGKIEVKSIPDYGSEFIVTLPKLKYQ